MSVPKPNANANANANAICKCKCKWQMQMQMQIQMANANGKRHYSSTSAEALPLTRTALTIGITAGGGCALPGPVAGVAWGSHTNFKALSCLLCNVKIEICQYQYKWRRINKCQPKYKCIISFDKSKPTNERE